MHRAVLSAPLRRAFPSHRRSFVSTVLLTKAWENETISELRKEARKRGLTSSGNKASLVSRIQQDDKTSLISDPVAATPPQVRHASTAPSRDSPLNEPPSTEVPGIPSATESVHPRYALDIQLPEASVPKPVEPVQVPFVPDLWESSKIKHESVPEEAAPSTEPKVVVIAGETSIPGSAPSHEVYSPTATSSYVDSEPSPRKEPASLVGRIVADMVEDLGVPPNARLLPESAPAQFDVAASSTHTVSGLQEKYSRPLGEDERTGLWALLGVLAGSLITASILAPTSEWAHKTEAAAVQDAEENPAGKKH